tara:strand:- start:113 stop:220 length:108 start_codon:yes stop_codon:yes gene_type:complete
MYKIYVCKKKNAKNINVRIGKAENVDVDKFVKLYF